MNTLKTKSQRIVVRYANITDLPKIIFILNQAIDAQANGILIKETVESKLKWFHEFDINTHPIYVATLNKQIVGFCTGQNSPGVGRGGVARLTDFISCASADCVWTRWCGQERHCSGASLSREVCQAGQMKHNRRQEKRKHCVLHLSSR